MSQIDAAVLKCPYCFKDIDSRATKCPECLSELRSLPKGKFNLEGWSKLVGFIIALATVLSLGADKLSALFLLLTGRDASILNLDVTDANYGEPKPNEKGVPESELASFTLTVTNVGSTPGVLYPLVMCLAEDLSKNNSSTVHQVQLRADTPTVVENGKLTFVVVKKFDASPVDYGDRAVALGQWSANGKTVPEYTCRFNYRDRHDRTKFAFTAPQSLLKAVQ